MFDDAFFNNNGSNSCCLNNLGRLWGLHNWRMMHSRLRATCPERRSSIFGGKGRSSRGSRESIAGRICRVPPEHLLWPGRRMMRRTNKGKATGTPYRGRSAERGGRHRRKERTMPSVSRRVSQRHSGRVWRCSARDGFETDVDVGEELSKRVFGRSELRGRGCSRGCGAL